MVIEKKLTRLSEPIIRSSASLCRGGEGEVSRQLLGTSGANLARLSESSGGQLRNCLEAEQSRAKKALYPTSTCTRGAPIAPLHWTFYIERGAANQIVTSHVELPHHAPPYQATTAVQDNRRPRPAATANSLPPSERRTDGRRPRT